MKIQIEIRRNNQVIETLSRQVYIVAHVKCVKYNGQVYEVKFGENGAYIEVGR